MVDGEQALEAVRAAAMSAVAAPLAPVIEAGRQELEAAREERAELVSRAYGRR